MFDLNSIEASVGQTDEAGDPLEDFLNDDKAACDTANSSKSTAYESF